MKLIIFDWGRTLYDPEREMLYTDTKPTLECLQSKGYTTAIVTLATKGPEIIKERLKIIAQEDLEQYFVSIKFDMTDKDKMYAETLQELEVEPSDVTIVDDRVIRGIAWGNRHGCTTIWVRQGKFAREFPTAATGEPDHIIQSLGSLMTIL